MLATCTPHLTCFSSCRSLQAKLALVGAWSLEVLCVGCVSWQMLHARSPTCQGQAGPRVAKRLRGAGSSSGHSS